MDTTLSELTLACSNYKSIAQVEPTVENIHSLIPRVTWPTLTHLTSFEPLWPADSSGTQINSAIHLS